MLHTLWYVEITLPDWLRQLLPEPLFGPAGLLRQPWFLTVLSFLSMGLFVLSLLGVPWIVRRIPQDYLLQEHERPHLHGLGLLGRVLRNAIGAILLLLGLLMLILPGQGLLTIIVGLMLLDFPGKSRIQRKIIGQPRILKAINRIRQRAGHPALSRSSRSSIVE